MCVPPIEVTININCNCTHDHANGGTPAAPGSSAPPAPGSPAPSVPNTPDNAPASPPPQPSKAPPQPPADPVIDQPQNPQPVSSNLQGATQKDNDKLNHENAYKDDNGYVWEKDPNTGKYKRIGYLDANGKFVAYSDEKVLKDNYGAKPMNKKSVPTGYPYDKAKEPLVDAKGGVWEKGLNGEYKKVGYIDSNNQFHSISAKNSLRDSVGAKDVTADNAPKGYEVDPNKYPMIDAKGYVWEWNKDRGEYEKVGYKDKDGNYKDFSAKQELNTNQGPTKAMDPNATASTDTTVPVPKGYDYKAAKAAGKDPQVDGDGNIWEYNKAKGKYEKVGHTDTDGNYQADAKATQPDPSKLADNLPGKDRPANMPPGAKIDTTTGDVYDFGAEGKPRRIGYVDPKTNQYTQYSIDDIMSDNFGAQNINKDNPPDGYEYDPSKYPKIDDKNNVWEWNAHKNGYENVGHVDSAGKFHGKIPPQPKPSDLTTLDPSKVAKGGEQLPKDKEVFTDKDGDVYMKWPDGKYYQIGHVNDKNEYQAHSQKDFLKHNYGAHAMDPKNVPSGFDYANASKDHPPLVDELNRVWEWNGKEYAIAGTISNGVFTPKKAS